MRNVSEKIHYGWVIVFSGILTLFACLGLGRFTLGMLLPSMGETLNLSYSQMGLISTGNFIGYLLSVVLIHLLVKRIGTRKTVAISLLVIGLSMLLVSYGQGFYGVLFLYFITGIGSGGANVPIMGLVSHWFRRDLRGKAAGYIVVGNGLAIMLTGWMVPEINLIQGAEGWRMSWFILGIVVVFIAAISQLLLRNTPEEMGLLPLGRHIESHHHAATDNSKHRRNIVLHIGAIYFMFGFSYVIYATFIVTTLVNEHGMSEAFAGDFWFWIGFFSLFSGPLFGTLSDKLGRKMGLSIVYLFQVIAYLLIALSSSEWGIYLSVFLFGICAWSVPSIMAATTGDYMGPEHAVAAFGTVTLFFGIGQIVGPTLAGMLAQSSGTFSSGYLLAAVASFSAVILLVSLKKPT